MIEKQVEAIALRNKIRELKHRLDELENSPSYVKDIGHLDARANPLMRRYVTFADCCSTVVGAAGDNPVIIRSHSHLDPVNNVDGMVFATQFMVDTELFRRCVKPETVFNLTGHLIQDQLYKLARGYAEKFLAEDVA